MKKDEQTGEAGRGSRAPKNKFVLRLFVTGASTNSSKAISNITEICEAHLQGRYTLEIIDVYQQGELARQEQIIALPMLIKKFPLPEKKMIGDLSETEKVLKSLGI